jgi:DNA invertase Pin-like site-specific DNA recombinase
MSGETCSRRVGVTRFKLNNQLATYVREGKSKSPSQRTSSYYTSHTQRRLLRDRLNEKEVTELVRLFNAGASKPELALQFDIGVGSVKKLLRQHGVKKRSRYQKLTNEE